MLYFNLSLFKFCKNVFSIVTCDFEQDMCLGKFQVSPKADVSWERMPYCISTNSIEPCINTSLTGKIKTFISINCIPNLLDHY